jgi:hypothetical protein
LGLEHSEGSLKENLDNPSIGNMIAYEIYSFDKIEGYELMGILPERRRNPKRRTAESVMQWGRMLLSDNRNSENIFIKQITIDNEGRNLWVRLSSKNNKK